MKHNLGMAGFKGKHRVAGTAFVLLAVCVGASAQPRTRPAPDAVVLAPSVHASASGELREAERAWRQNPADEATAVRYARAVFVLGLTEGDLRWYGAAKAAIAPWWTRPAVSAPMHFMRALVRQGFHDFEGGIADLSAAIALDPASAEAWSWRFSLHLLTSKLDQARADCAAIGQRFGTDEGQACEAILRTRTGRAAEAVPLLERLVTLPAYQGPLAQDWLRYHLGDALRTAGDPARAVAVWQAHLQARPRAHLVRLSLAELLNAQGRAADALRVSLVDAVPGDGLLVQALLASQALGDGQTARLASLVAQRLQSQALRDEALIERPQMVYLIRHRRGDAQDLARGLSLAAENWRTQQEPPDAALLVEAALASNQPAAAAPVLDWLQATGYTDPTLAPLAQTLRTRLGR